MLHHTLVLSSTALVLDRNEVVRGLTLLVDVNLNTYSLQFNLVLAVSIQNNHSSGFEFHLTVAAGSSNRLTNIEDNNASTVTPRTMRGFLVQLH